MNRHIIATVSLIISLFIVFDYEVNSININEKPIIGQPIPLKVNYLETYFIDIENGYLTEASIKSICQYVGKRNDISPELLQAVAYVESTYKIHSVSNKSAKGICQIIPKWNKDLIKELNINDIYDPYQNVLLCANILNELSNQRCGNDIYYVLMAYNEGSIPARKRYLKGIRSNYAKKVIEKYYELGGKDL